MTKEAKVGLLLGLGFIVAIAVVLRDVHQNDIEENNPLDSSNVSNPYYGAPLLVTDVSTIEESPVDIIYGVEDEGWDYAENEFAGNRPYIPDGNERFSTDLPRRDGFQNVPEGTFSRTAEEVIETTIPPGRNDATPPGDLQQLLKELEIAPPKRIYVVVKGDSLSSVAVKVFGAVEGNRLVNIDRIFEANRNTMKTKHSLQIGQKLVIPNLPGGARVVLPVLNPTPRVEVVRTPAVATPNYVSYTVKKGDSLWKIAVRELGDGAKFTEIAFLNDHVLSDENSLKEKMVLRLPVH